MWLVKGATSVVVSLAMIAVVTAILWSARLAGIGPHHPVFFYLMPIAAIAILFGTLPAMLSAAVATASSAYFLYDPVYSFHVANTLEWGDLICFGVLASMGVKCTVDLLRPGSRISPPTPHSTAGARPLRAFVSFRRYRPFVPVEPRQAARIHSWDAS